MHIKTLFISLMATLFLCSCSGSGTKPIEVENVSQGILAASLLYETVGRSLASAESANIINEEDAQGIRDALSEVYTGLGVAIELYRTGNELEAEAQLNTTRMVLYSAQAILTSIRHNIIEGEDNE